MRAVAGLLKRVSADRPSLVIRAGNGGRGEEQAHHGNVGDLSSVASVVRRAHRESNPTK